MYHKKIKENKENLYKKILLKGKDILITRVMRELSCRGSKIRV
ncbi:MAG: hypothetical protein PV354_06560 [Bartonella sp.]|nr:hypothetical protein [Bartonella sp.]